MDIGVRIGAGVGVHVGTGVHQNRRPVGADVGSVVGIGMDTEVRASM